MIDWHDKVKRLLKAELAKRGLSHYDLVCRLKEIGVEETTSSINSKISRGTFSAAFLVQCLYAIGCTKLNIDSELLEDNIAAEDVREYIKLSHAK